MTAALSHDEIPSARSAQTTAPRRPIPVGVQVLSTILFGAFAITATAIAFDHFWPAGVALAVILGWRGGFVPMSRGDDPAHEIIAEIRGLSPEAKQRQSRTSGNASFDAYRNDTLERLETEQENFADFLDRLRDARDQREFDGFMDSRAAAARAARLENAEA